MSFKPLWLMIYPTEPRYDKTRLKQPKRRNAFDNSGELATISAALMFKGWSNVTDTAPNLYFSVADCINESAELSESGCWGCDSQRG